MGLFSVDLLDYMSHWYLLPRSRSSKLS